MRWALWLAPTVLTNPCYHSVGVSALRQLTELLAGCCGPVALPPNGQVILARTLTAVGRLLASLEITPQKPLRRAYERDPEAVEEWVHKTYPKLRRRAKRLGASIFFLDEAGFSSEPGLGRTYGLKGQTPVVSTTGQRQKVSAISAVNAKGAFWSKVYTGMLNASRFVGFPKD